jgi:hypothetical protein
MNLGILFSGIILVTGLILTIICFCAMSTELAQRQDKLVELLVWISGIMVGLGLVLLIAASEGWF